ncbi:MAG: tRNA-dihydrouridine synthase [Candidatus ainarchaeum sp.]|nr:tRNA-dihydrouridine synthase [Candidatus ainarchaeum sp.]MDD3976344.1 tRNA-dihydrouridine synthase [Candidatus ainarchaeum sp.]
MTNVKIGNISIKKKGVLGPMLEYTTHPYRLLCNEYDCGLCFSEMVYINQLVYAPESLNNSSLLNSSKKDSPSAFQLVGDFSDSVLSLKAVEFIDNYNFFDIIDFNTGCPSNRVINGNSGSGLLKNIDSILSTLKNAKGISKKPITVKTRLGFDKVDIFNNVEKLVNTGIDAITIHARKAIDSNNISSDYNIVRKLKKEFSLPIIYNGDITDDNFFEFFDFDLLMVSRNALGNPFVFKKINYFEKKNSFLEKNFLENLNALKRFHEIEKKNPINFVKKKNMALQFIKDFQGASFFRNKICVSKSDSDLEKIFIEIEHKLLELQQ